MIPVGPLLQSDNPVAKIYNNNLSTAINNSRQMDFIHQYILSPNLQKPAVRTNASVAVTAIPTMNRSAICAY